MGEVERPAAAIPAGLWLIEGDAEEATVDEPTSSEWISGEWSRSAASCSHSRP